METTFLGNIKVTYLTGNKKSLIPDEYEIREIVLEDKEGNKDTVKKVYGKIAEKVREGFYKSMEVYFV